MSSQQPNLLCLYGYDPLNRLIDHSQTGSSRLQRFYCKSRLATEIQGTLEHSIFQHDDQLLAQRRLEGDICVNALLATDQQRSVLHTLDKNSAPMPIAYSPYGHRHGESGLISLLGFNGERPDPVTGHYLLGNGYRAFNPVLMRFNSPDSLSPFGSGGFNPYAYCLGDPVNRYDPNGHVSLSILKLIGEFEGHVRKQAALRKIPQAGFNEVAQLDAVANTKGINYFAGKKGLQVLELKDPLMPLDKAIKQRDNIIGLEFSWKRNVKNKFYFEYLDFAEQSGEQGRLQFLKSIRSAKTYKAFDGKKVKAGPSEYADAFEAALENKIGVTLRDLRKDVSRIRDRHFMPEINDATFNKA
jgi:RHS repeat-associated protein